MFTELYDGYGAVEQAKLHSPDVITLDITMPNMDGMQALKEILIVRPETQVVMISAVHSQTTIIHAIMSGAKDFIVKPFDKNHIETHAGFVAKNNKYKDFMPTHTFIIDIEISEDKLKAYANYTPPKLIRNNIVDADPINKLDIQITEIILETKKISKATLIERITHENIVFGLIDSTIEDICENNVQVFVLKTVA